MTIRFLRDYQGYSSGSEVSVFSTAQENLIIAAGAATRTLGSQQFSVYPSANAAGPRPTNNPVVLSSDGTSLVSGDGTVYLPVNNPPLQRPYRMTVYGDSRASFMTTSTLLAITGASTALNGNRAAPWIAGGMGDAEMVANFGNSGDTAVLWASSSRSNSKTINNLLAANLFKGGPVDVCYVQYGINDYIAGTSAATVSAAIQALCTALMGAGIKVILEATNPASAAQYSASAAAKLQATIDGNAALKAWAAGYPRQVVFVDTFNSLVDATGYASTTYYADGLHFNQLGAMLSGAACATAARAILPKKWGLIYTSGSLLQPNLIDWGSTPTMHTATDVGTVTYTTPTWNIDATTGLPYAEVTATCTVLSSGRAYGHLEISATPVTGATPRFPLSIGDELQGSAYVTVDDGAGGIAPVQAIVLRQRAYFDTKFAEFGGIIGAAGSTYTNPVAHRMTTPTIVTATASGAIVNTASGGYQLQLLSEFNTVGQSARIRVYAPSLRVISQAQPTQPAIGASPATYTNTTGAPVMVYVAGGTVSAITIARQGTALTTGFTSGAFRLAQNDSIVVTYTVAPTLTVVPDEAKAA